MKTKYPRDRWYIYRIFLPKGWCAVYVAIEKGVGIENVDISHRALEVDLIESDYLDDMVDLEFKHVARSTCDICGRDTAYYAHGEGICDETDV